MVKNITKLSEESKHSQAENTEKSQSTEVDIKVRLIFLGIEPLSCVDSPLIFMLFSAFRQSQLIQNAAARAHTKIKKTDHVCPGLRSLQWLPPLTKNGFPNSVLLHIYFGAKRWF